MSLILSLRAPFVNYFNKCLENNNAVKCVAFCKSNPMSSAGNTYRMLVIAKNELTRDYQYGMKDVVS